jgi:hypothetical protein
LPAFATRNKSEIRFLTVCGVTCPLQFTLRTAKKCEIRKICLIPRIVLHGMGVAQGGFELMRVDHGNNETPSLVSASQRIGQGEVVCAEQINLQGERASFTHEY